MNLLSEYSVSDKKRYKICIVVFFCLIVSSCFQRPYTTKPAKGDALVYYRYPLSHTGYYPDQKINPAPSPEEVYGLINHGIHTASKSSPVIAGQYLYVGSDTGYMYAFDIRTLTLLWKFRVPHSAEYGNDSIPVVLSRFIDPEYAANVPEFANMKSDAIRKIIVK